MIATFFRDYHHAAAPMWTIHVVTRPTIAPSLRTHTHDHACNAHVCTERNHAHNNTKFREENFRDQKSNHEIYENTVPRKFGAIRYNHDQDKYLISISTS